MTLARNLGTFAANVNSSGTATTAISSNQLSSNSWTITTSSTKVMFNYNGTNVFSIDTSGNIIAKADITGFGTP